MPLFDKASNQMDQQGSIFTPFVLVSGFSETPHDPSLGIKFQVHKNHFSITAAVLPIVTHFLAVFDNSEQ